MFSISKRLNNLKKAQPRFLVSLQVRIYAAVLMLDLIHLVLPGWDYSPRSMDNPLNPVSCFCRTQCRLGLGG